MVAPASERGRAGRFMPLPLRKRAACDKTRLDQ
jgi:hypothetical protein